MILLYLVAKVEAFSAGGSLKDRIAYRMILQAEAEGVLNRGKSIIVEPTSGNTGVGLCLCAARLGYKVIITLPEKMSLEKERTMLSLGAEIIRTPTDAPSESPHSNIGVAKKIVTEVEDAVMLDQYSNLNNALAHEFGTALEIIDDLRTSYGDNSIVDVLIAGCGTGGTITGLSRGLRKHNKKTRNHNSFRDNLFVVGVDPVGSTLALPSELNELKDDQSSSYAIEGNIHYLH